MQKIRVRICKSAMTINYDFNFKGEKMTKLKLANLEELRARYDFVGILAYFKSGELVAWCDKNGFSNESSAIKSIPKDSNETQIHLRLYEILNGADNTPQWLRDYFVAYSKWEQKQDELSALIDKALPLYKSLEKNNYAESEADKKERESLDDKIRKIENAINALDSKCETILDDLQYCDDIKEQWQNLRLHSSLAVLAAQKCVSNHKKQSKINDIVFKMASKQLNKLSAEELNMSVFALPKSTNACFGD